MKLTELQLEKLDEKGDEIYNEARNTYLDKMDFDPYEYLSEEDSILFSAIEKIDGSGYSENLTEDEEEALNNYLTSCQ